LKDFLFKRKYFVKKRIVGELFSFEEKAVPSSKEHNLRSEEKTSSTDSNLKKNFGEMLRARLNPRNLPNILSPGKLFK
jgi:hypothetical protein